MFGRLNPADPSMSLLRSLAILLRDGASINAPLLTELFAKGLPHIA
jgi:hypothetical protein